LLVLETEVDTRGGEERALFERAISSRLAHIGALGDHELDGWLGVPVLVHVSVLLVSRQKGVETVHSQINK
jgi:hypothetical protein